MSVKPIKCKCGGKSKKYPAEFPEAGKEELRMIICDKCGFQAGPHAYISEAVREWNLEQRRVY